LMGTPGDSGDSGTNSGNEFINPKDQLSCCDSSKPNVVIQRWQKLGEELWDKKRNCWNISKVPEISDAVTYDLSHHPRLAQEGFLAVHNIASRLNRVMVPNEYGPDEKSRLLIGSLVCGRLLRKLKRDLDNCIGKGDQIQKLPEKPITTAVQYLQQKKESPSITPEAAPHVEEEDEDMQEAEFAGIDLSQSRYLKSASRRVRTRLYFTSESHIQTLMNVLHHGHGGSEDEPLLPLPVVVEGNEQELVVEEDPALVCPEAEEMLDKAPVLEYLTQIVFRLYEDKRVDKDSDLRHRVEVLFSPGAVGHPQEAYLNNHMMKLQELKPLHRPDQPLTLSHLQRLLNRHGRAEKERGAVDGQTLRRNSSVGLSIVT